ncbi:tRNA uridine 5-oxyacetic acid(34) methyltransferase CmoM [Vibrio sp. SCSIO 43136]|uniref:tRNA uridine 5-oxyacetic acid(34) methyltransferase CmoM n=1 Tax=Vibrio sp. SCSIO 43136 TaxID=2819101 RepID=UPI0020761E94|nr:tRNA uridine 5-oxyacetic acid(34) methyltransferase CmoM [Vibrio sp. SCSIO 43136]USD66269.1 tRNA uridine 5-oxyacetic acid(34) methyltransferase CmoM [Vibrio sp. SCSIO 43136]
MITQATVTEDRNFDDIAHKFAKNIYQTGKGDIRQTIVWEDLIETLHLLDDRKHTLSVLDAGGGLGQMSQKIAERGHQITLCDLSAEMLKLAQADVESNQLSEQYRFVHCPAQEVAQHIDQPVDLVLFHAVMEWLAKPKQVLEKVLEQVKPGGRASIMFYNQHGLVYKNVVCGNIPHVLKGMPHRKRFKLQPQKGLLPEEVYQWIEQAGFEIEIKSGIRCFHDYISDRQYMGDYTPEDVLELEQKLCRQEPYLSLGRYIHVTARKKEQ